MAVLAFIQSGPASATKVVQNFSGGGKLVCPCFAAGDQVAVVFDLPASEFPIEITGVGIAWDAQFGVSAVSTEAAIYVYRGIPPTAGLPSYTISSPVLRTGTINEFVVDTLRVESGPFTVSLQLSEANMGMQFAPSVVHDGNGCQAGRNLVFSTGAGWRDARAMGFTGDWEFQVFYQPAGSLTSVGPMKTRVLRLKGVVPNPFNPETTVNFELPAAMQVTAEVWSVAGIRVRSLAANRPLPAGDNTVRWDGRNDAGRPVPSGVYFIRIRTGAGDLVARAVLLE